MDDRPRTHACETPHPLYGGSFPLSAVTSARLPRVTFAPRIIYGQGQDTRAHSWPSPGPPGTTNKVTGGLALRLYDVTTLYFKAEKEDDLCKVGYSKEHRGDPQVIVGLLVDRGGFPLRIGCWEGNRAETTTITGVVETFQAAHGIAELVIVSGRRHALGGQPDNAG